MKWLRILKYGLAARILDPLVRHTSWLDGDGIPPSLINFAGGGDFKGVGHRQVELIRNRAGLTETHRVLDVGSGIGRIALALAESLPRVEYDGFDIVRYGISWCKKRFHAHPSFRFHHADIRNTFYNPFGRIPADAFTFPYPDGAYDRVIATSVFTHLLPSTSRRYLSESARVLRKGGRLYLTAFIVPETGPAPGAVFRFANPWAEAWVESVDEPELAVGYPIEAMDAWAREAGFRRVAWHPGSWSGSDGDDFQDALVYERS